jgi:uncharacterized protein
MSSLNEIKNILSANKEYFINKYSVKNIGIFGSYARNEANPDSDIDILIDFEKPIGLEFVTLADELENLLNTKVDLVSVNAIQPKMMTYLKEELIYV